MSSYTPVDGSSKSRTVYVTGAGGFIASWLVKLLLEKGYTVKGTVRNPEDLNNDHLRALMGASKRLVLCKADLLNYESLKNAIHGCVGVFHTASPMIDDLEKMLEPAVKGTKNVIDAAAEAGVRRVVFTSTVGAVYMDPNRDPDALTSLSGGTLNIARSPRASSMDDIKGAWARASVSQPSFSGWPTLASYG